jgi:hypothetical protein
MLPALPLLPFSALARIRPPARMTLSVADYPHGDSKFPHAIENFLQLKITEDHK